MVKIWKSERLLGYLFAAHEARIRTSWETQRDYKVHAWFAIMVPVHRYSWYEVKTSCQSGLPHHLGPWIHLLFHLLLRTPINCFSLDKTRTPATIFLVWSNFNSTGPALLPPINQPRQVSSQPTSTHSSSIAQASLMKPTQDLNTFQVNPKI